MELPKRSLTSSVDIYKNDLVNKVEACHQQQELVSKLKSVDFSKFKLQTQIREYFLFFCISKERLL